MRPFRFLFCERNFQTEPLPTLGYWLSLVLQFPQRADACPGGLALAATSAYPRAWEATYPRAQTTQFSRGTSRSFGNKCFATAGNDLVGSSVEPLPVLGASN